MRKYPDIAFTPEVLAAQQAHGSRDRYAEIAAQWPVPDRLHDAEIAHISARDNFYLSSVGSDGWPYVQHRGGPVGFVRVIGPTTIGWVELIGNKQLQTQGHVSADDRVAMILVDYPARTRLKLFGHATVHTEPDSELLEALGPDTPSRHDGIITVEVVAYDWNCPKQITPRFSAAQVREMVAPMQARIEQLEAQIAASS